jgi:glycosyltransferase involved in cell wall biosynthesis
VRRKPHPFFCAKLRPADERIFPRLANDKIADRLVGTPIYCTGAATLAVCDILHRQVRNKPSIATIYLGVGQVAAHAQAACLSHPNDDNRSRDIHRRGRMKIAQVSPLMEAVPPKLYGGTERIVSYIADELAVMGHDVTLFASGDSTTKARLEAVWPRALRLDETMRDYLAPHLIMLQMVAERAGEFDIIHSHMDYLAFPIFRQTGVPFVTTLHGRLDLPELGPLYNTFDDVPVVSISDAQREPLPHANFIATVHHGIPTRLLTPGSGAGGYLAFIGRISPEKAPDAAIRIAAASGMKLKIAAKVDAVDREYFTTRIAPLLKEPNVEYIGEISDAEKSAFLGNAAGLIFPIAWREPFGLAMIEAMACGTPVIALRRGSVPEVIDDGVTGFIVDDEAQAAAAARRLHELDRIRVRHVFEVRFSVRRMTEDYLSIYRRLIARKHPLREAV